jgi:hypothetical protein
MTALLIILACFAGIFAFAYGTAGLVGLLDLDRPPGKNSVVLLLLDQLLTLGLGTFVSTIARNWSRRPEERRLLGIAAVCGALCLLFLAALPAGTAFFHR